MSAYYIVTDTKNIKDEQILKLISNKGFAKEISVSQLRELVRMKKLSLMDVQNIKIALDSSLVIKPTLSKACACIDKVRDDGNGIYKYVIAFSHYHRLVMRTQDVKKLIQGKHIDCINLSIDVSGRLVYKELYNANKDKNTITLDKVLMKQALRFNGRSKNLMNTDYYNVEFACNLDYDNVKLKMGLLGIEKYKLWRIKKHLCKLVYGDKMVIFTDLKYISLSGDSAGMFSKLSLKSLSLNNLDTSRVYNMSEMFKSSCIDNLDLSGINTSSLLFVDNFDAGLKSKNVVGGLRLSDSTALIHAK